MKAVNKFNVHSLVTHLQQILPGLQTYSRIKAKVREWKKVSTIALKYFFLWVFLRLLGQYLPKLMGRIPARRVQHSDYD